MPAKEVFMKGKTGRRVQDRNGKGIHDTYYNKQDPQDHSFCKKCHAIFHHKHWYFNDEELMALQQAHAKEVLCPACQKIADKYPSGVVTLKGSFIPEHRDEILNLIKNEEERAMGLNPLERIIEITPQGEGYEVTTTHEKLAQRIGKRLHSSYSGNVAYRWTPQDKMARVSWNRD